jgi:glycoprotein endo-alpha-1,2-mannosidase
MRIISLFARVPVLLVAVAASHLPNASLQAAASSNAGPTETAGMRTKPMSASASARAVAFYYPWYGNPTTDGHYANWNHPVAVRNEPPRSFPGGDDIGSNFYPNLGCYSVNDPKVLREHMRQLRQAGVGVLCASWWGRDTFTDRALPGLFKAAEEAGLLINFHIEPFPGRNATSTRAAIAYLVGKFGTSPACQRLRSHENKPVFFIYDSYLRPASEWATVLRKEGTNSIRGSAVDAVVLGLWVKPHEERFMIEGGFDGFYTYFATDGFTFGSTLSHWPKLADWARTHQKLFVPCVAPGYIDTRIRPWNGVNTREREAGAYYDRMWIAALKVSPELVGITSFNEWHEGTQIETSTPKQIPGFNYLNYQPLASDYYLDRTAQWIRRMNSK